MQLGQFIASSPTLFPSEYVAEFQQTLDRAPPVPMSAIEATLKQELGQDLQQLFSHIDPVPIATASVVRDSATCSLHPAYARAQTQFCIQPVTRSADHVSLLLQAQVHGAVLR